MTNEQREKAIEELKKMKEELGVNNRKTVFPKIENSEASKGKVKVKTNGNIKGMEPFQNEFKRNGFATALLFGLICGTLELLFLGIAMILFGWN